jgi:hypothetical protein
MESRYKWEALFSLLYVILFLMCVVFILTDSYERIGVVVATVVYGVLVHKWYKRRIYISVHDEYERKVIDMKDIVANINSLLGRIGNGALVIFCTTLLRWALAKYPDKILASVDKSEMVIFLGCATAFTAVELCTFSVSKLRAFTECLEEAKAMGEG